MNELKKYHQEITYETNSILKAEIPYEDKIDLLKTYYDFKNVNINYLTLIQTINDLGYTIEKTGFKLNQDNEENLAFEKRKDNNQIKSRELSYLILKNKENLKFYIAEDSNNLIFLINEEDETKNKKIIKK